MAQQSFNFYCLEEQTQKVSKLVFLYLGIIAPNSPKISGYYTNALLVKEITFTSLALLFLGRLSEGYSKGVCTIYIAQTLQIEGVSSSI